MFCKLSQLEIFELLHKRKVDVKNLVKLPKLEMFYTTYISRFDSIEIIPDIEIFGYEDALKENYYLETNYSNIESTPKTLLKRF